MPNRAIPPLPALNQLSQPELRSLWQDVFDVLPPTHAQRDLLVCCLIYRQQELASGGIRTATRRQLLKLAQDLAAGSAPDLLDTSRIKSGTRLVREWQGKTHEVIAVEDGFRYRDKAYKSLSVIARLITGTRWSGPVFFGVKRPSKSTKGSRGE
jgi:hypothetical protein